MNVDVIVDRIVVSNKVNFGKKHFKSFISHKDDHEEVIPLCIMLPKMSPYRKDFHETKENELKEKYNKIWGKVNKFIKKRFDSEAVYNEQHLKPKIKSFEGKVNTNFSNDKMPKEGSHFVCQWCRLTLFLKLA